MRVVIVGSARDRERLRSRLDASIEVVGEFGTLSAARAASVSADAIVLAARGRDAVEGDPESVALPYVEPLTSREQEVLELLAEGLPNKAIAARLGISDQTVKFHVASISAKLGATNRTEAVRLALRRGILTL